MKAHIAALALLWVLPACSYVEAGDASRDAGPPFGDDASEVSPDGSLDASPTEPPTSTNGGFPLTDGGLTPDMEETCYDGEPNEPGSERDCESSACQLSRACCVGNVDCCGPAPDVIPLDVDFTGCEPGDQDAIFRCLDPETPRSFGEATGRIVPGGLAPGGSLEQSGGFVLREGLKPRTHRLVISTQFAPPIDCGSGCVDSAGVGLLDRLSDGSPNTERPAIALILGGNGRDVRLAVRGEERARWTLPPSTEEQPTWRLRLDPSGALRVFRDDQSSPIYEGAAPLIPEVDLVLYARNRNPSGPVTVSRIASLSFAASLCDIPDAWSSRTPLTLFTGPATTYFPEAPSRPSLSKTNTGIVYLAFVEGLDSERRIRFGRQNESAPSSFTLYGSAEESSFTPDGLDESRGVTDPALIWDETTSRMHMYYTRVGPRDATDIHRATWDGDTSTFVRDSLPLRIPHRPGASRDSATVVRDHSGSWLMIYRERYEGVDRWKSAVSYDGRDWFAIENSAIEMSLQGTPSAVDEVADPTILTHAGAYLLHYSRRRGARWSVGAFASHTFLHWRRLDETGPILSRTTFGFDSLSVRSPTLISNASGLEMVYVATSGEQDQLGYAVREASSEGMFAPRAD